MRFSDEARQRTAALRAAIHALPFNRELAAGALAPDRFSFYITQDALYLAQYSRVLALAAAKAPDTPSLQAFAGSALGAIAVEQRLHEHYLAELGISPAEIAAAEPAPDCLAYTSFLLATAHQEAWPVLIAALLPCFWIYWDVASAIIRDCAPGNPYQAWIDTYANPAFGESVKRVIGIADAAASAMPSAHAQMLAAFTRSAQYEYLFWDGTYQRRLWPKFD
jgi:thiaminase (transcriptional activator TenA)